MGRRTFGWVAAASVAATLLAGVPSASAAPSVVTAAGPLTDLLPAAHATDGSYARVYAIAPGDGNTYFYFVLTGLNPTEWAPSTARTCMSVRACRATGRPRWGTTTPVPQVTRARPTRSGWISPSWQVGSGSPARLCPSRSHPVRHGRWSSTPSPLSPEPASPAGGSPACPWDSDRLSP